MQWSSKSVTSRNQLYGIMKYQLKCSLPGFFVARAWCWSKFGPGIEYEHWHNFKNYTGIAMPWAWDCAKFQGAAIDNGKLYLLDDAALDLFKQEWTDG